MKNAVLLNRGADGFVLEPDHALAAVSDVNAALWGDYDNDGLVDVYFCRRGANQLWRQTAAGVWSDVTLPRARAPATEPRSTARSSTRTTTATSTCCWSGSDAPAELLNNNGNGTFRALGTTIGFTGASSGVVVADLDADRDADLIVIVTNPPEPCEPFEPRTPNQVLLNDRTWQYHRDPAFDRFCRNRDRRGRGR